MLTTEQKEDLRHAALEALAIRAPAALSPRQLIKAVKKEVDFLFEESDLVAALNLLEGVAPHPLAASTTDELGSTMYWSATAAGVLHVERS
jgi:hypothetical protein